MACRLIIGILMIAVEPAVIQPIDEVAGKTKEPMVPRNISRSAAALETRERCWRKSRFPRRSRINSRPNQKNF